MSTLRTATEVNNRGFEIERSTAGSEFITAGFGNFNETKKMILMK